MKLSSNIIGGKADSLKRFMYKRNTMVKLYSFNKKYENSLYYFSGISLILKRKVVVQKIDDI